MHLTKIALPVIALVASVGACLAQDQTPKPAAEDKFFRLDFVVREIEAGRAVSSHAYSTTAETRSGACSIRAGDKLPISDRDGKVTYIDIGISLDCSEIRQAGDKLTMYISADVTLPATDAPAVPVILHAFRWKSPAIVALRKPTIIETSDDLSSKRRVQLELTATPLN